MSATAPHQMAGLQGQTDACAPPRAAGLQGQTEAVHPLSAASPQGQAKDASVLQRATAGRAAGVSAVGAGSQQDRLREGAASQQELWGLLPWQNSRPGGGAGVGGAGASDARAGRRRGEDGQLAFASTLPESLEALVRTALEQSGARVGLQTQYKNFNGAV